MGGKEKSPHRVYFKTKQFRRKNEKAGIKQIWYLVQHPMWTGCVLSSHNVELHLVHCPQISALDVEGLVTIKKVKLKQRFLQILAFFKNILF